MNRVRWAWALTLLVFVAACGPSAPPPVRLTVLFFNDLHGHLLPFSTRDDQGQPVEVGGIARLAGLVQAARDDDETRGARTVVLVAGDILQGTPMSTVFKGKPDIEALNRIGVDAMTIGNHEFDFGFDNFLELKSLARFPFLSANVVYKETGELVAPAVTGVELAPGLELVVIGATTPELLYTTNPEYVTLLDALPPADRVREAFLAHRHRGPVILLSHCRHQTDREIAAVVPELTAIIAGHDQILFKPIRHAEGVPVFQAFEKGRYLGRIDLEIDPVSKAAEIVGWAYIPITDELPADPGVEALVESYAAQMDVRFQEVIGEAAVFLAGERGAIRYDETALGNFVTDVMREYTGVQVALLNAGSLRSSLAQGPITLEAVFTVMPYENELVSLTLTGQEVLEALTRAVRGGREDEDGGFLHVSGLTFTVRGKQVAEVVVGGEALRPDETYTVAVTDFLASGGDGYTVFQGKELVRTRLPLRELLVDTIRHRGVISAAVEGRMVRRD